LTIRFLQIRFLFVLLILLFFDSQLFSQSLSNFRQKTIPITSKAHVIDSLSIIPESIQIFDKSNTEIDTTWYKIDFTNSQIIWQNEIEKDSAVVQYRVFPINFSAPIFNKDSSIINEFGDYVKDPFAITIDNNTSQTLDFGGLNYNGSFARDLSVGNNQNLVVNSNFNLQFSGMLKNDVEVLAAISDQNIPIQPEGNTAQLQEFDRIFIQFKKQRSTLTFGDFEVRSKPGYFLKYLKKLQGFDINSGVAIGANTDMKFGGSLAVAKGKFTRNTFNGIERNQGPYKLKGVNNELFIIILSGTERVFIDGKLLTRGATNDYVIDYNLGEVIFTANQLITKDKRIVVEFEYAEQYYQKTLLQTYQQFDFGKANVNIKFYSEQDGKNQPIQGPLNESQLNILNEVGNNTTAALLPGFSPTEYNDELVQYSLNDTTANLQYFDSIFVYTNNQSQTLYNVTFNSVGVGNGNYIISDIAANNRVYEWIAPDSITGLPKGEYEPFIRVIAPRRNQMLTVGASYDLTEKQTISAEIGLSNSDPNTLSEIDNDLNKAIATKVAYTGNIDLAGENSNKLSLTNSVSYEWKQAAFLPVERYRPVEFRREWNLGNQQNIDTLNENWLNAKSTLKKNDWGQLSVGFGTFNRKSLFDGKRYSVGGILNRKLWKGNFNSSYLNSSNNSKLGDYIIHHYELLRKLPKLRGIETGFSFDSENNQLIDDGQSDLTNESFQFNSYQWKIKNSDTAKNKIQFSYTLRDDFLPKEQDFEIANRGNTVQLKGNLSDRKRKQLFNYNISYRDLINKDTTQNKANEKTVLGQTEYRVNVKDGFIRSSTLYEIGSGQQQKIEYTYAEVEAGLGNFAWTDYNNNDLKEDFEFEIAAFTDSARYIRLIVPTDIYLNTNSVKFNQSLKIKPKQLLKADKWIDKTISKFQYDANFLIDRKNQGETFNLQDYNPFYIENEDSNLVSSNINIRNAIIYNRNSAVFSLELFRFDLNNKIALITGFDQRKNKEYGIISRYNVSKTIGLRLEAKDGLLGNFSDAFSNRIYNIDYWEVKPSLTLILSNKFRSTISYRYKSSENIALEGLQEKATQNELELDTRYNILNQSSIRARFAYDLINFNENPNTSLAYTILEGLRPGNNYIWSAGFDKTFKNNISLGISYDGRKLGDQDIRHTGRANLRAVF